MNIRWFDRVSEVELRRSPFNGWWWSWSNRVDGDGMDMYCISHNVDFQNKPSAGHPLAEEAWEGLRTRGGEQ